MKVDYLSIKIEEEQAAHIAKSLYGIEGEITTLPGEIDFNFRIKTLSKSYILKISRPEEKLEYLQFQQAILRHVAGNLKDSEATHIYSDLYGNDISEVKDNSGRIRKVRLLSWMDGRLWSSVNPVSDELQYSLGEQVGKINKALQGFDHPHAHRSLDWDIAQAAWTFDHLHLFTIERRRIAEYFKDQFESFQKDYKRLRKSVVHNDANDNNILVTEDLLQPKVKAIIDFGDAVHTQTINDPAIAIAYAVMHKPDVLSAALPIISGCHEQFPLLESELPFLYNLVAMRLIISVTKSAINKQKEPDNEYLLISEQPAWDLLLRWKEVNEEFALYSFRSACGYDAHPNEKMFKDWALSHPAQLSTLFPGIGKEEIHHIDLSVSSTWIGHLSEFEDFPHFEYKLGRLQEQHTDAIIVGGYLEPRPLYNTAAYDKEGNNGKEIRSIHLVVDFCLPAGTAVHAMFDGIIIIAVHQPDNKEYGGLIILKHKIDQFEFYTLYGHLSLESAANKSIGQLIIRGEQIGVLGEPCENGNWAPHLHFQLLLSILGYTDDYPGVAYPRQKAVWESICPDPNLFFSDTGLERGQLNTDDELISFRKKHLGKSLSLSYSQPVRMVRGAGAFLIDATGRRYLDTVNNVAHVGHEHRRVVRAGQDQIAVLNTNTRYLHETIVEFTAELLSTFPKELSVVHFVNSGSEANELALRMARAVTRQSDMIAVEVGYHGNTSACIDVSSYKFDGKGGQGSPEHTHIVPLPDAFRGLYRGENTGALYAAHVQQQIAVIQQKERNLAGFICESIISCGGQIELPENYLKIAYDAVRNAGGVCIADEVQVGCGRIGSKFWGFQLHNVIPDIVTIGKPIGNGHPLAAVVCTPAVAEAFANGMEYFNTFGGNPVSCAIGREVLRVIKDEHLQQNALTVGNYLKAGLKKLSSDFPVIGDVRGLGLFLGFELVDAGKKPLGTAASYLVNRMKDFGILMSTDGKDNNVLKIKPSLVFSKENADELLTRLKTVLSEDFMLL